MKLKKQNNDSKIKNKKHLKINKTTSFIKTEKILYNYNSFLIAVKTDKKNTIKTQKLITKINQALELIKDDPYYSIIEMIYFEGKTREQVAEFYDVEPKTLTYNKKRLINILKTVLLADLTVKEILK